MKHVLQRNVSVMQDTPEALQGASERTCTKHVLSPQRRTFLAQVPADVGQGLARHFPETEEKCVY